jgi:hypothetical protein
MYQELGLTTDEIHTRPGMPELIVKNEIDSKYKNFTLEDLATSHCHIVTKAS